VSVCVSVVAIKCIVVGIWVELGRLTWIRLVLIDRCARGIEPWSILFELQISVFRYILEIFAYLSVLGFALVDMRGFCATSCAMRCDGYGFFCFCIPRARNLFGIQSRFIIIVQLHFVSYVK
jgi:hypothetical protein